MPAAFKDGKSFVGKVVAWNTAWLAADSASDLFL